MRREALKRLLDAFEAIASVERFIDHCTLDQYLQNELIQAAVERQSKSAVDQLILWDAIQNDLPGLKTSLQAVLNNNPPIP